MAQLLVRNLPDEVKERLQRRAKSNGRSLEAEVRDVLEKAANSPHVPVSKKTVGWATALARTMSQNEVPDEAWDEFDRALREQRSSWRDRPIDIDP
jgi:plasmid stability protein